MMSKPNLIRWLMLVGLAGVISLFIPACLKDIKIDLSLLEFPDPCPWPRVTTTGSYSMAAKINRQNWVACVGLNFISLHAIECDLRESDGSNRVWLRGINSRTESDTSSRLELKLKPLEEGLILPETLDELELSFRINFNNGLSTKYWQLKDPEQLLHLEILRLDTSQNILAGQFSGLLISENDTDTLLVADGRFDIRY